MFLARRRHLQALDKAKELLLAGQQQLSLHKAGELLAEDLRLAHQALGEITGEFTSDDLLGHIFSSFCIGKNSLFVQCINQQCEKNKYKKPCFELIGVVRYYFNAVRNFFICR